MEYHAVVSSSVVAVAFDSATSILGVRFLNGLEYHYFEVPELVYNGLLSAVSVGSYLNEYVKRAGYRYQRVK